MLLPGERKKNITNQLHVTAQNPTDFLKSGPGVPNLILHKHNLSILLLYTHTCYCLLYTMVSGLKRLFFSD